MYCTNCGNKRENNEKYCINCGTSYIEDNEKTNNSKTKETSLILGIISFILILIPLISIPLAIISIITGIKEKKEGTGSSIGMIFGIISLILSIILCVIITLFIFTIKNWTKDPIENWKNKIQEYYNYDDENFFNKNKNDDLKGKIWQGSDDSTLYLNENNTYEWYSDDTQKEDNYYMGEFDTYNGLEAIKYIEDNLTKFGFFEEKDSENLENYYILILTCKKSKIDGKENKEETKTYYYGTLNDEKNTISFVNITTRKTIKFNLKDDFNDKKHIDL